MIETEYKGYKITFNENTERWIADLGDLGTREKPSLTDLKKVIDKALKATFKRQEAIRPVWYYGCRTWELCTVTSKTDDGCYWIINENDRREKVRAESLFALDDHNKEVCPEIKVLEDEEDKISQKIDALEKTLHPFKEE